MKAKKRIYAVIDKSSSSLILVRAYSSTQARSFIAAREFGVAVATTETVYNHVKQGGDIVDAAQPETADAFEPQCGTPCPEEKPVTDAEISELRQSVLADDRRPPINEVA